MLCLWNSTLCCLFLCHIWKYIAAWAIWMRVITCFIIGWKCETFLQFLVEMCLKTAMGKLNKLISHSLFLSEDFPVLCRNTVLPMVSCVSNFYGRHYPTQSLAFLYNFIVYFISVACLHLVVHTVVSNYSVNYADWQQVGCGLFITS